MLDNALKILLGDQLDLAVKNAGWDFDVVQKDQPHQEGTPDGGTVFFEKLFDDPYGFAKTELSYDATRCVYIETEKQWVQTTFQISALKQESPDAVCAPTASDVANQMKMHMGSRFVVRALIVCGVGLYRIGDVRNPYFDNDKVRFEAHPSFDVVLTHERIIQNDIPAITVADAEVHVVP